MHVTHYKAGSQWIYAILRDCVGDRVVDPKPDLTQFLGRDIKEGTVFPALYVTRDQFEAAALPPRWRRFVVIRDLRDTLVSAYFSAAISHVSDGFPAIAALRAQLAGLTKEEGLLKMTSSWLGSPAEMQRSWLRGGVDPIRFEDLVERDTELLETVLIDECELPVSRRRLGRVIKRTRFRDLSGGREPGQQDPSSHWRKGIAGDWRNHFTEPVKERFKELWGEDLIAAGYERDHDW